MVNFIQNQLISLSSDQTLILMIISALFFLITVFAVFSILPFLAKKRMIVVNIILFIVLGLGWSFIFKISSEVNYFKEYTHAFSEEKVFLYRKSEVFKEIEYKYIYPRFYSYKANSEQDVPSDTLSDLNPISEKVCIRFLDSQTGETFSDLCKLNPEALAREYFALHRANPSFVNFLNNTYYNELDKSYFNRFIGELNTLSLIE